MDEKLKILCVDDERINLKIISKMLSKKYQVETASGAMEALDILEGSPEIKLIISDMRMPQMTGLELIKKAKKRFPNKKYFILSGYAINDEIQEAIDNKIVCYYFAKPANFEAIEQAIQDCV